jgi:ADP-heptose:LPS heptosyltransferase
MKLSTKRWLDSAVGRPLCYALSGALRVVERRERSREVSPSGRVLFIQLSEMGSPILAAPAFLRLKELIPGEHCFVILERNSPSLYLLGLFKPENVFTLPDDSVLALAAATARFAAFCRQRRIEITVDMELFSRVSSVLSMCAGARTRVGFHNYDGEGLYRGEHLTHAVNYNPYLHMSQNFLALVEGLAAGESARPGPKQEIALPEQPVRVDRDPIAIERLRRTIAGVFPLEDRHRLIVINHDAGKLLPIRTWPASRYVGLIRRLLETVDNGVVLLLGLPFARESAEGIEAAVGDPRCVNFVGRTESLSDLVQLFHIAELLITNDSGPAHFASLTPIKAITLFGPETPVLYGPTGPRAVNLHKQLACSPCLTAANHRSSPCQDNQCLKSISVDEVFDAAKSLLESVPTPTGSLPG